MYNESGGDALIEERISPLRLRTDKQQFAHTENMSMTTNLIRRHRRLYGLVAAGLLALGAEAHADSLADQGKAIATAGSGAAVACASCHGAQGQGMAAAGFPYLAAQGADYLARQLQDFASGKRANPVMQPIAKALSAEQVKAVAAYFSQLPPVMDTKALAAHEDTYPPKGDAGAWLANRGDWSRNVPACVQCHGPGGIGVGKDFPAIAGQPAQYIHNQLAAWKDKKRDPGPLALMGDIAARMDDAQMTAVSDYFSKLPAAAQSPAAQAQGAQK